MLLLPIGHEETSVRRLPVVTFGIMAICIVAFVLSGQGTLVSDADIELDESVGEALEYYWEHPYLEIDDEFETLVYGGPDSIEEEYSELAEAMGEWMDVDEQDGPGLDSVLKSEQAELDRLTDAALESRDGHSFFRWGLVPADFSLIGLVSHMFMHGGWMHLIGNLLILYLAGPYVEDVWGRPLYASVYFLSGIVAALAHIAFNAGSEVPMIGASGAIAGVMGAFLVNFHQTKIKFFYMVGFFWRGTFDAAAWVMLPLWFGEQFFMAVMLGGAGMSGVAYWAHVGGFAAGLGSAFYVKKAGILERYVQPRLDQAVEQSVIARPDLDLALTARDEGRLDDAFDLLNGELRRQPADADTAELYWDTAAELGRQGETTPLMLRSLQAQMQAGETEAVRAMWLRMAEADPAICADAPFLVRLTRLQLGLADRDSARETLRRALLAAGAAPAPALALKIGRLASELDPAIARGALRALIQRDDVSAEDRAAAEGMLEKIPAPARLASEQPQSEPHRVDLDELPESIPLVLDEP